KVEKELMTKSYKMVVLKYLLEKGPKNWLDPVTPTEVAPYFHQFYMEKNYRKQIDFSNKNTKKLWEYDEEKVAKLIDRKSTRLNSSHVSISYAVFCLKKKK